ncbi:helix-turn-helix domain-containing protein [Nocardioides sp.]|uniref:helix-turn-helix transcriptional regulator n=1 Tax=Nocardioides sp. TaxID=35761 RepID=UPI00261DF8B3|nr:helix-turn-helix domain-containing protein [Nocardioides sp.]
MPKKPVSPRPEVSDAVRALGAMIRRARIERGLTAEEFAGRLAVSRPTLAAIERGEPTVAIGTTLNAAALLGIPLFSTTDPVEVARLRRSAERDLGLIPSRVDVTEASRDDSDF